MLTVYEASAPDIEVFDVFVRNIFLQVIYVYGFEFINFNREKACIVVEMAVDG